MFSEDENPLYPRKLNLANATKELRLLKSNLQEQLILAAESGHTDSITAILAAAGSWSELVCKSFFASNLKRLVVAFSKGHTKSVVPLLYGYTAGDDREEAGGYLLSYAAKQGCKDSLKKLVELGVEINRTLRQGGSPLYCAARSGQLECVLLLLEAGADPNLVDEYLCYSPLSKVKSVQCAQLLVEYGADVNQENGAALQHAVSSGDFNMCKFLLECGARPELDCKDPPLLVNAIDSPRLLSLLIRHGADLEAARYKDGCTPLIVAAIRVKLDSLRILLQHGANAQAKADSKRTALHVLCDRAVHLRPPRKEISSSIRLLVKHKADPNALDSHRGTALLSAIRTENPELVRLLLECGATELNNGVISLEYARASKGKVGNVLCAHFLKVKRRRTLRGIVRFLLVSRRYLEDFYRHKYVAIGERSFSNAKRQLQLAKVVDDAQPKRAKGMVELVNQRRK